MKIYFTVEMWFSKESLCLLKQLSLSGLDFVLKGGKSLILLMP
jgi:hypothetical protein